MKSFEQAVALRRTNYALGKDSGISAETILKSLETVITAVPSAFNMQSARVVLALGDKHQEIWDITKAALQKIVPEQNFPDTEAKINGFAAAQ
ncbi:MAG: nitroreductase family protein, partial [Klebsiella pneumoniae]|nr:nitroreductase family protein [Klebsiella pneumoniae]